MLYPKVSICSDCHVYVCHCSVGAAIERATAFPEAPGRREPEWKCNCAEEPAYRPGALIHIFKLYVIPTHNICRPMFSVIVHQIYFFLHALCCCVYRELGLGNVSLSSGESGSSFLQKVNHLLFVGFIFVCTHGSQFLYSGLGLLYFLLWL